MASLAVSTSNMTQYPILQNRNVLASGKTTERSGFGFGFEGWAGFGFGFEHRWICPSLITAYHLQPMNL